MMEVDHVYFSFNIQTENSNLSFGITYWDKHDINNVMNCMSAYKKMKKLLSVEFGHVLTFKEITDYIKSLNKDIPEQIKTHLRDCIYFINQVNNICDISSPIQDVVSVDICTTYTEVKEETFNM